ncbi:Calcineurin-like phosphoesterase [Streptococcus parauberis]|uniref:metallophosphoesterase family protein n=1 Tax=Streptococcus parauberis TaxID=1348 RepID=UPI000CCE92A3|nr:metallophosphoesterase [Streptococcus parauberis]PNY21818.1 Calcineurin-like phosphoesterase [Streptococcus parauberis]
MKTLFIGDTHLKSSLILPLIDELLVDPNIKRIIFMGDYTDFRGQEENPQLYAKDLLFLKKWIDEKTNKNYEVITLIGNHDINYYNHFPADYSLHDAEAFLAVSDFLDDFNLQVAYKLDDYLVSHAGFNILFDVEDWHFDFIDGQHDHELIRFSIAVGPNRGGRDMAGSPVWADFSELEQIPNEQYYKQIVGHTPQKSVNHSKHILAGKPSEVIGVDTFAVDKNYNFYGNGEILIYDDISKTFDIKSTNWVSEETKNKLINYIGN